ncbi:MAG: 50S ribosomal protein L30 [Firmicutes bacterium]|nr:50S ribosomal protein L30 [Bacillota bacterium]
MAKLEIKLVRSLNSRPQEQIVIARTLGLGKLQSKVIQEDNPAIRGMVNRIRHLVEVKEI